jgi:hypothetical protein
MTDHTTPRYWPVSELRKNVTMRDSAAALSSCGFTQINEPFQTSDEAFDVAGGHGLEFTVKRLGAITLVSLEPILGQRATELRCARRTTSASSRPRRLRDLVLLMRDLVLLNHREASSLSPRSRTVSPLASAKGCGLGEGA